MGSSVSGSAIRSFKSAITGVMGSSVSGSALKLMGLVGTGATGSSGSGSSFRSVRSVVTGEMDDRSEEASSGLMAIEPAGGSAWWVFRESVGSVLFVSTSRVIGLVVVGIVDISCLNTKLGWASG